MKTNKLLIAVVLTSFLFVVTLSFSGTAKPTHGVDYGPMAKLLPSNGKMRGWIRDIWRFGDEGEYGYRVPGSPAEEAAADYIYEKFEDFGLTDVTKQPFPAKVNNPDTWSLTVRVGEDEEEIPSFFIRYSPFTGPEGITADLVYVGSGSEEDFINNDVEGKIVLVDMLAPGWPMTRFQPFSLFTYDPDDTLPGDMATENWPVTNLESSLEHAKQHGALGYIGILTFTVDDNNQFGSENRWDKPLPAISVSPNEGAYLRSLLESEEPVEATMVLDGSQGAGSAQSVYGFLPGNNKDEILLVASHSDGWATNDASGTAVVMALAKYFSHFPEESRERTLMFALMGCHFGQCDRSNTEVHRLIDEEKIIFAFVIEMISKQFKIIDGKYVETGFVSPRAWQISPKMISLVPMISEAIVKYDHKRSLILPLYNGEVLFYTELGLPAITHISTNAPQFTNDDTPNTVMVSALKPTVASYVDMIEQVDLIPIEEIEAMRD